MSKKQLKIKAVDLFCGIGGLTRGFINQGIQVVAGIDNDPACEYGYRASNKAEYLLKDIREVTPQLINGLFGDKNDYRVLVGCAPCQPYSGLNQKELSTKDMEPLERFAFLISKVKPDVVSMENVSGLAKTEKYPIFQFFLNTLQENGYQYSWQVVNAADYGVPQSRRRLVLLASRLGPIQLIGKTHIVKKMTVKNTIGRLKPIADGETDSMDPLHRASKLSDLNKKRIKSTKVNGGNSSDWSSDLVLKCHRKKSGKTYKGTVYGRMRWDQPAPTMTTQCIGIGNGRFGHPEQNRAISLREAALFQTFPKDYTFYDNSKKMVVAQVAKFIGNAVPVRLGEVIAQSINNHLIQYSK